MNLLVFVAWWSGFAAGIWWARRRNRQDDGMVQLGDMGQNDGVTLTCLWCMEEAFRLPRAVLFKDREPKPCGSCQRPVWFVSQRDGSWYIS